MRTSVRGVDVSHLYTIAPAACLGLLSSELEFPASAALLCTVSQLDFYADKTPRVVSSQFDILSDDGTPVQ